MTDIPEPVTTEWLFSGAVGMKLIAHLNLGRDGSRILRDLVVIETGKRLGMGIVDATCKKPGGRGWGRTTRTWAVYDVDASFACAEDALEVFNRRRRDKLRDEEWEASDPRNAGADPR